MSKKKNKTPKEFPPKIPYQLIRGREILEKSTELTNGKAYYVTFGCSDEQGTYSKDQVKVVPEKKIIEMRKKLQAQMDFLDQFY